MAEQEAKPYSIKVWDMDEFFAELQTFPDAQQKRITDFMAGYLRTKPRTIIPGQLTEMHGRWEGVFSLECGKSRRLMYEVDDATRTVRIIYLGKHPEWEKRRKWS